MLTKERSCEFPAAKIFSEIPCGSRLDAANKIASPLDPGFLIASHLSVENSTHL